MLKNSSLATWGAAVLLLSSLSSCEDVLEKYFPKPTPPPTTPTFPSLGLDIPFYALSSGNRLDAYSTKDPNSRTSSVAITGLGSGELLLAIDFRPATGQLYGVSSGSRLYVINQNTGVARAIGTGAFTPAVAGNLVGFDFNPTVDRIRLVTSTGQNLRLNPETGTVAATDGVINGAAGATVTGAAYTNNTAGASTTVLYDLDPAMDQLYRQDPPNEGTLVAVGSLNLNITGDGGFDIDARTGTALGLYSVNGNPTLFTVDLSTGAARPLAQYNANFGYSGIAIPTRPVAYGLLGETRSARNNESFLTVFDFTVSPAVSVTKPITGLQDTDLLTQLDFRPANGQLYAVSSAGRLYTINAATAAATYVGQVAAAGIGTFDFDPVEDQIRFTSGSQNGRINPTTAVTTFDRDINPVIFSINAVAYDNNFAGATTSTMYVLGINGGTGPNTIASLFRVPSPNTGALTTVGRLDIPEFNRAHFDIGGTTNTGYADILTGGVSGRYGLYTVDLSTGALTLLTLNPPTARGFTVGLGF